MKPGQRAEPIIFFPALLMWALRATPAESGSISVLFIGIQDTMAHGLETLFNQLHPAFIF